MTKYPHADGELTVLGPEIFTDRTGEVISWKGENYVRQNPNPHRPPSERCAQYLGEISVTIENRLRAKGHVAAADEIVGIMRELATDGSSR